MVGGGGGGNSPFNCGEIVSLEPVRPLFLSAWLIPSDGSVLSSDVTSYGKPSPKAPYPFKLLASVPPFASYIIELPVFDCSLLV